MKTCDQTWRRCTWPKGPCSLDEEFTGCHDAEDFYDPGDTGTCRQMAEED